MANLKDFELEDDVLDGASGGAAIDPKTGLHTACPYCGEVFGSTWWADKHAATCPRKPSDSYRPIKQTIGGSSVTPVEQPTMDSDGGFGGGGDY